LLIFRDGRRVCSGPELLHALSQQLQHTLSLRDFHPQNTLEELMEALLRSGELECAVADHDGCELQAKALATLTDELAFALVSKSSSRISPNIWQSLRAMELPDRLALSTPEGFCYYALHPLDYVDALNESGIHAPEAAVVGIRSIGTTLSAVVRAYFSQRGVPAERITVRPTGHPFDRKLALDDKQREWVHRKAAANALFLVVDEGPGLSGSSFLAVAEALVGAGASQNRIVLMPSSTPDLGSLFAPDAKARWSCFTTVPLRPTRHIPAEATQHVGCGEWRKRVFPSQEQWPAVWTWTERKKYLSTDGTHIFRFGGYGHYGKAVRQRLEMLHADGWGPEASGAGDGFNMMPWIQGTRPLQADRDTVVRLAGYCAFRATHFQSYPVSNAALEQMAQINLERALGITHPVALPLERPVIADARMMPHEWIYSSDGRLLKVDSASHGDDHFYPGPTDIAWDLAGAITEWKLDRVASDLLVSEYNRISGDAVENRLPAYVIAYCAFRLGFTLSAAQSVGEPNESARFKKEAELYRKRLAALLPLATAA
jgi:hypothetical protein